jgi:hypothetical protein
MNATIKELLEYLDDKWIEAQNNGKFPIAAQFHGWRTELLKLVQEADRRKADGPNVSNARR